MKKSILVVIALTIMLGSLAACSQVNSNSSYAVTENENMDNSTEESSHPIDSAGKAGYQPGEWTMFGYTSKWLNMSFDAGDAYKATEEQRVSVKRYSEALRKNDPYNAFQEMVFGWSNKSISGEPICLTIQPLTGEPKDVCIYADEREKGIQESFDKYNIAREIVETNEEEIFFCGASWLKRYAKTIANGREIKNCSLYRILDNCLVCLSYETQSVYYNEKEFLSCFTALKG